MNAAMNTVPEPSAELLARAGAVRLAAVELGQTNNGQRSRALHAMADALQERSSLIVAANVRIWSALRQKGSLQL
jgi:glutamate-5-semialdehyde dehydrogenase